MPPKIANLSLASDFFYIICGCGHVHPVMHGSRRLDQAFRGLPPFVVERATTFADASDVWLHINLSSAVFTFRKVPGVTCPIALPSHSVPGLRLPRPTMSR